jgi:cobalamin biosynthesis protein CbiD
MPLGLAAPLVGNQRQLVEQEVQEHPRQLAAQAVTVVPVVTTSPCAGAAAGAVEERQEMQDLLDLVAVLEVQGRLELQVQHQEFQLLQQLHIQLL